MLENIWITPLGSQLVISASKTYEILMPTGPTVKKYTASVNETTDIVLKVCYDEGKPQF